MKFALFATTAVAASIVQRDAAAIESDVSAISSATANLDTAIKAITGPSSKNAVLAANAAVLSAINKAITDTKATSSLTTLEGASIAGPITSLSSQVSTTVNDLIAKKSLIVSAGLGSTTEDQLTQVQSASAAFASDLTAIVPSELKSTAQQLSQQILGSLASGVAAFKGTGGSSSAPASSATSAPASSAPASSAPASSAPASSVSSAVSSASSAVSSAVSSVASSTSSYPTGASNGTSSSTPSSTPYTGAAATQVVGFGGLVAAAVAVVAAL